MTTALAILAPLVVPLATILAMGTYQGDLTQAAATAAQQTAVTAILITDAELPPATSSGQDITPLCVDAGRHAGDQVLIQNKIATEGVGDACG